MRLCEGGYMENTAYLVGQMLKISDELHAFYCKTARNGTVPAKFVGNSVFLIATKTPVQALARLCVRMTPYIAWAKRHRVQKIQTPGEESWKANWYLRMYEEVASKLAPLLKYTKKFSDVDKAQLLMGYLAAFPELRTRGLLIVSF